MNDKTRAAMQQALEVLKEIHPGNMTLMAEEAWNKATTAIREALAQQKLSDSIRPKGKSITKVWVDEINQTLEQPEQEQDRQIDQLIQERDHRDEIIDKLCDAVLGPDRYEWSSQYFFEDAVREVEERMAALEQPAQQEQGDSVCQEDGGCPTELAVLQRFWRGQSIPDEHYPAWFKPAQQEPVAWTARELELIDGMIEVQLDHAQRCDSIANRTMAAKQKGWDMERVALLQKIRATPPAAQTALKPLTDEEIAKAWSQSKGDIFMRLKPFARAIEAAHGIKGDA